MKPWESGIRKVTPYIPGEQPRISDIIKLNTNENPYPPSPAVEKVISGYPTETLRLYPDPACQVLVDAIAEYYGIGRDCVFVGIGSDDVLALSFLTFFNQELPILFPDITYSFYDVWAELYRIPFRRIPLDEGFAWHKEDYRIPNGGIVLANPNAPTGLYANLNDIEDVLSHNPDSIVIIDEAYIDFGGTSALPLLKKYDNLLIVQTFSKSRSLAGMRIGYAMGNPLLIRYLNDVKYSFNSYTMNRVTLEAGAAAIKDRDYFVQNCQNIIHTREESKKRLARLGFSFPDSMTNFIFASHEHIDAEELFTALKEHGIFVRHFGADRIKNYLRITIGLPQQMDALFDFLASYIEKHA